jgi:hypothetical protein
MRFVGSLAARGGVAAAIDRIIDKHHPGPPAIERIEMHPIVLSRYNKDFFGNWDVRRPGAPVPPVMLVPRRSRRRLRTEVDVVFDDGDRIVMDLK